LPNWDASYQETFSFLTEILGTDSGREQRRALRSRARHGVSYSSLAVGNEARSRGLFAVNHSDPLVFADEVRSGVLLNAAAVSGTTATLTTTPTWLAPAEHLIFQASDGSRVAYDVASVSGATATLTAALDRTWPAGTRVFLGLPGRLVPQMVSVFRTNTIETSAVEWLVEPGSEVQPVGTAPRTFNGREMLTLSPNWSSPLEFETNDPISFIDPGMGVRSAFRWETYIPRGRKAEYLVTNSTELNETLGLFLRCRGRQGEFYQPTMTEDLPLMQTVTSGNRFWRTPGHAVADAYGTDQVHRAIAVFLRNGDIHGFRVAALAKGGTVTPYTQIETVEAAPVQIAPADVLMICWMPVVRFGTDDLDVRWRTNGVAEIMFNTLTLEDLA
jgi:hypothetical protein